MCRLIAFELCIALVVAQPASSQSFDVAKVMAGAEKNNAADQYALGLMYTVGDGVPRDFVKAVPWLRKAAEQGMPEAQLAVGMIYEDGRGVVQNHAESAKWYERAANQGVAAAQARLGLLYAKGQGVRASYVTAHKWMNLAAARSTGDSQVDFASARELMAKQMSRKEITAAQNAAAKWQLEFERRKK